MCVHVYVCVFMYVLMCTHAYTQRCVLMYMSLCVLMCVHMCVCVLVYMLYMCLCVWLLSLFNVMHHLEEFSSVQASLHCRYVQRCLVSSNKFIRAQQTGSSIQTDGPTCVLVSGHPDLRLEFLHTNYCWFIQLVSQFQPISLWAFKMSKLDPLVDTLT